MKKVEINLSKFEENELSQTEKRNLIGGGPGDGTKVKSGGTLASQNYGDGAGGDGYSDDNHDSN